MYVSYFVEARMYSWLYGQVWFQRAFKADNVRLVRNFLDATGLCAIDPALKLKQIVRRMLLGDKLRQRWRGKFEANPSCLRDLIAVQGQENLERALQQKRGVILAMTHAYATHLVPPWLAVTRAEPQLTINYRGKIGAAKINNPQAASTKGNNFSRATEIYEAMNCLRKNGIVGILSDGYKGEKQIVLQLYGHNRAFRLGFAELALQTGAVVLPVSVRLDLDGRVQLIYHSQLHSGEANDEHGQRVENLVRQYAGFLASEWAAAPGDITQRYVREYLSSTTDALPQN
jgi:KDO2-lipid IV(A) lauroyltransferase